MKVVAASRRQLFIVVVIIIIMEAFLLPFTPLCDVIVPFQLRWRVLFGWGRGRR